MYIIYNIIYNNIYIYTIYTIYIYIIIYNMFVMFCNFYSHLVLHVFVVSVLRCHVCVIFSSGAGGWTRSRAGKSKHVILRQHTSNFVYIVFACFFACFCFHCFFVAFVLRFFFCLHCLCISQIGSNFCLHILVFPRC